MRNDVHNETQQKMRGIRNLNQVCMCVALCLFNVQSRFQSNELFSGAELRVRLSYEIRTSIEQLDYETSDKGT